MVDLQSLSLPLLVMIHFSDEGIAVSSILWTLRLVENAPDYP